jgi:hypothetical protein
VQDGVSAFVDEVPAYTVTMVRWLVVALAVIGGGGLAAQKVPLRSSVELTVVTATVRDENGKLVTGLRSSR